jgi:secretion system chaperone SscA
MSDEPLNLSETVMTDWIDQVMEGQNAFAQASEEKIQELYALAYVLYCKKKYFEASHFFRLLIVVRPLTAKFWKGFGACLQMQKDYDEALNCYLCCSQLTQHGGTDPYLYVHAADCYFALNRQEEGLKALEVAHLSAKQTEDQPVLQHVALMKQMWSKDHCTLRGL